MKFWSKTKNKIKNFIFRPSSGINDEQLLEWLGISNTPKKILSEVTYFTCLKMLSETLGKLPLKFYRETNNGTEKAEPNQAFAVLKNRPNKFMTPSLFWATVENNRNHYGNAYVWIRRKLELKKFGGTYDVVDYWIMPSNNVTVVMDDKGIFGGKGDLYYYYSDSNTGEQYVFPSRDVLHYKTSMTFDGIIGKPVREILKSTIEGGLESQNFMNNLYEGGLTAAMALQYTGDLDENLEDELIERFERYTSGSSNAGKIVPVPVGMQLQPLNIKLTDSQFFELKKFSSLQIASAFGIKPNQINNYEKSSYANSEMQQLSFYIDTELFIIKQYEEENNFKLLTSEELSEGYFSKFNENVILRADSKTQKDILCGYVSNGIKLINEARDNLGLPRVEGGDIPMVNGTYIPLSMVGEQYKKGGEN